MDANKSANGQGAVPVVARRRRRVARQLRESTPDPARDGSVGSRSNSCDDQSGSDETRGTGRSTVESSPSSSKKSLIERAIEYGSAHRNKILARKDKKLTVMAPRSRSVPRDETEVPSSPEIFSLLRRAKRSLSTARKPKTDDSSDGGRISDTEVRQRRERIERFRSERSGDAGGDGKPTGPLQANLQRFNEERRRFELEKLKFLQEKRELDRMRLRRFEKYREEMLEEQSRKLQAKLQQERARSIEATPLPPLAPSVAHRGPTPTRADTLSPPATKKKILIVPKARSSSHSASSSEDEGRLSSDEEKKARETVRRRFSPRKPPKRSRSAKSELLKPIPVPDTGVTSPESELPSDFQPEEEPESVSRSEAPQEHWAEKEPEMVLTQRRVAEKDAETRADDAKDEKEQPISTTREIDSKGEEKPIEDTVAIVEEDAVKPRRRRPLVPYVEKPGEVFGWGEIGKEMIDLWRDFLDDKPEEIVRLRVQVNHCLYYFAVMVLLCGLGGIAFRLTEGTFESQYKCGVKRVKREFIDHLWLSSHNQREEDWKLSARNRLRKFEEELQIAFEAGMKSYSGNTAWNFVNGVIYSLTVVSTIGYGHISPSTTTGRALTILYAIIGIPIFLIVLADFGKLFTRGIKFVWSYVRRLYYTGSLRKVRKTTQVQEVMKGLNVVYDMVRRPSADNELQGATTTTATAASTVPPQLNAAQQPTNVPSQTYRTQAESQPGGAVSSGIETIPVPETPTTPVPETFEIDDEFNLPISLAIVILVGYMLFGATIYCTWENWSFFEAFYFVFISISTIGFGDYVPQHPIYMMCSILYLIFGLALTSMCINVVQLKLSDSFRQASAKIGATIGLQMAEAEMASQHHSPVHTPIEMTGLHTSTPTSAPNASLNGSVPSTPALPARPSSSVSKPEKKE
uniref:Potassium channel domain-containing protein n=1 Tax=Anopheles atroparvus TaxID=41427 RepID=A0AAG5DNM6_ANOAO